MAFQGDSIYWVEVEKVVPNPFQPRRDFDPDKLQELADSIRMYGVLQPLTVTRKEVQREDGTFYSEYELIAGERRLRASKLAGIAQVPVIIREGEQSEQEKLELAIIENLQREDLNAIDRAVAFKQLTEQFGLSHSQVAKKVGRSREYVSNSVRLLALPETIQQALKHGDVTEGHARTLLMLSDRPEEQDVIFRETMLKKLSVREVERIVRKIATDKVRKKNLDEFDANLIELEKQFTETLGTRVQIQKTEFGGKLTIDYFSEEDLAVILKRIKDETSELNPSPQETAGLLKEHTPLVINAEEQPITMQEAWDDVAASEKLQQSENTLDNPVDTTTPIEAEEQTRRPEEPSASPDLVSETPQDQVWHERQPTAFMADTAELRSEYDADTATPSREENESTETEKTPAMETQNNEVISPAPEQQNEAPADIQTQPQQPPKDDESDLYSIRNFSV